MDSQLETLALIAAAVHRPLRERLDASQFNPAMQPLIEALKDGKTKASKDVVKRWLERFRVTWDGKTDIGTAIVEAFVQSVNRERLSSNLKRLQMRVRLGSNFLTDEQLKAASEALEGLFNGDGQSSEPVGKPHP